MHEEIRLETVSCVVYLAKEQGTNEEARRVAESLRHSVVTVGVGLLIAYLHWRRGKNCIKTRHTLEINYILSRPLFWFKLLALIIKHSTRKNLLLPSFPPPKKSEQTRCKAAQTVANVFRVLETPATATVQDINRLSPPPHKRPSAFIQPKARMFAFPPHHLCFSVSSQSLPTPQPAFSSPQSPQSKLTQRCAPFLRILK